jgi:hypothetical protein
MDSKRKRGINKDRVAAIASFTSPSRLQSVPCSDSKSVCSAASSSTTSSRARGELPQHITKQLAEDIEADGGIATFITRSHKLLSNLLDKRPDLYGKRGDEIRKRIQKKVYYWQKYHKAGTYAENILSKFQIQSAAVRNKSSKGKKKRGAANLADDADDSDDDSSISSSDSMTAADKKSKDQAPRGATAKRKKEPSPARNLTEDFNVTFENKPPVKRAVPASPPSFNPTPTIKMSSKYPGVPEGTEIVNVDLERPERNGQLAGIFKIKDIEGLDGRTWYYGICILMEIDIRYLLDSPGKNVYTARLRGDHTVLLTVPGWTYLLLNNLDLFETQVGVAITDGIDDAIHTVSIFLTR